MARASPNALPTDAPAPAPTDPSGTGPLVASPAARAPMARSGRASGAPTARSYRIAPTTSGTTPPVVGRPTPRASRWAITPKQASSPKALPPASTAPWIRVRDVAGVEDVEAEEPRGAAAYLDGGHSAGGAEHGGASGEADQVGGMADQEAGDIGQPPT